MNGSKFLWNIIYLIWILFGILVVLYFLFPENFQTMFNILFLNKG